MPSQPPKEFDRISKKEQIERVRAQLANERSSHLPHWRDLGDFLLPRRPRWFVTDSNKGDRRSHKIIDPAGTLALRSLRAGMSGGFTNQSRPWFELTTADPDLAQFTPVKEWLDIVTKRMRLVFNKSNLYNVLPTAYSEVALFANAAIGMVEDFESVVRFQSFPIGSFMIANDEKHKIRVFVREFQMTVRQIIEEFARTPENRIDWSKVSQHVKDLYDEGNLESWIHVVHSIRPNPNYDPNKARVIARFKRYESVYYEATFGPNGRLNSQNLDDRLLRESGFDFFPVLAPRWETTGEDAWGTNCPGMTMLGDVKQLQIMQRRKAQALEHYVKPPMVAPVAARKSKTSVLPGDVSYLDDVQGKGYRRAFDIDFPLGDFNNSIVELKQQISRASYEDLFLMLAQTDRRQITAREIDERREEKLIALGPVVEQLNQDLLDPLIDNTFEFMLRQNILPPPPEELQGSELKIDYVSMLHQAQKLIGINTIERFTGFSLEMANANPEVLDKIDMDRTIDIYGEQASVPFGIIRDDEVVAQIRQQRAAAQQAQQQAEAAAQSAKAARDLSQAETGDSNLLDQVITDAQAGALV